jgi:hypothetical protein
VPGPEFCVESTLCDSAVPADVSVLVFALAIPSMCQNCQVWHTGSIARKFGDVGFEVATALS